MSEVRESSVVVSLSQLWALEQQRVLEERISAQIRAEAEAAARVEADRRAREAALAKARVEDERRRQEEARAREEEARLLALRQAEVARARAEAERRIQLEAAIAQQEHERVLRQLAEDPAKQRLQRRIAVSAVAGALALGASLGLYFGKILPDAERRQLENAAALAAQDESLRRLQDRLDRVKADLEVLQATPLPKPVEVKPAEPPPRVVTAPRPRPRTEPTPPKPPCNKGDPMCSEF